MVNNFAKAVEEVNNGKQFSVIDNENAVISLTNVCNTFDMNIINDKVSDAVLNNIKMSIMLNSSLNGGCREQNCNIKNHCTFRCSPSGNSLANIMIVKAMPSDFEFYSKTAFSDSYGLIIRQILYNAGLNQKDIYYTSLIKCSNINGQIDSNSVRECMYHYILNEICDIVKPKAIVLCGSSSVSACIKYGLLPKDIDSNLLLSGKFVVTYNNNINVNIGFVRDIKESEENLSKTIESEALRLQYLIQYTKED